MKVFLLLTSLVIIACAACNNSNSTDNSITEKSIKRNTSITKANSYSDLFLDSATVEQFITQQKVDDTTAAAIRDFYNARNFEFAWFVSDGLTEQALAFHSLYDYSTDSSRKYLDNKLDKLMTDDSLTVDAADPDIKKTELMLTWRFTRYIRTAYKDEDTRAYMLEHAIPAQKMSVNQLAKTILSDKDDKVDNSYYQAMKKQLKTLVDSSQHISDSVATAKDSLINKMKLVLINLERMRWLPAEPKGRLILVNIPEFRLHAFNGNAKDFDMDVVVGKEGHSTVMFSGNLNQVVFSPYWNIPPSIVRKEIVPAMNRNKDYLKEKNMEITGEENGLPVVRQLPGEKNELGKVKFLFPNSFHIYFHDTPHKELFNRDKRASSHGCIRLSDAKKMAEYVLQNQPEWTPEAIDSAMNSGKEHYVRVKDPVPVLIYYFTSWVDENGVVQSREDIYGHDRKLENRLFTAN